MGLLVVLACLYATQEMNFVPFFLFSVTMRPMYFVYGLALIDAFLLILYEIPGASTPFSYSPSAHLGGMLAGWLFFRFLYANQGWDRAASWSWLVWKSPCNGARRASAARGSPRCSGSGWLATSVLCTTIRTGSSRAWTS